MIARPPGYPPHPVLPKRCLWCDSEFWPSASRLRHCSDACERAHHASFAEQQHRKTLGWSEPNRCVVCGRATRDRDGVYCGAGCRRQLELAKAEIDAAFRRLCPGQAVSDWCVEDASDYAEAPRMEVAG